MAYSFETIHTELKGKVLYATIENPPINLIDQFFVRDLISLFDELDADQDGVRVVVFRSADPDFFINHVDVLHITEYTAEAARSGGPYDVNLGGLFRRLSELGQVTITVLEGRARAAGSEFALATDMRFGSKERAILGQPEVGSGRYPGAGAVQHVTRLVGRGNAFQVILAGDDWDATEAERIGLINKAIPDAELLGYVENVATRIAGFSRRSVQLAKRRINSIALPPKEDTQIDGNLFAVLRSDPEVGKRLESVMRRGFQTRSRAELEYGAVLAEYEEGPSE